MCHYLLKAARQSRLTQERRYENHMDGIDGLHVKGATVVNALKVYIREEKPVGISWRKVIENVYFSRIICVICDIDESFSYEIDKEVDCLKNSEKTCEKCPTEYGEVTIEKKESNKIYVSVTKEPCLTQEAL